MKLLSDQGVKGFIIQYNQDAYEPLDNETNKLIPLLRQASEENLNLIVDLEAGTSNQWFNLSEMNTMYKDFYVWKAGKIGSDGVQNPPNNWVS